jgi:hypothetical protein
LGVGGQGRVAAGEHQLEPLVGERRLLKAVHGRLRDLQQPRLRCERPLAADAVDGAVARRGDQPGSGVRRLAVARPALGRDRERVLRGPLGEVEIAEEADQGRENPSPLLAERVVEGRDG